MTQAPADVSHLVVGRSSGHSAPHSSAIRGAASHSASCRPVVRWDGFDPLGPLARHHAAVAAHTLTRRVDTCGVKVCSVTKTVVDIVGLVAADLGDGHQRPGACASVVVRIPHGSGGNLGSGRAPKAAVLGVGREGARKACARGSPMSRGRGAVRIVDGIVVAEHVGVEAVTHRLRDGACARARRRRWHKSRHLGEGDKRCKEEE